MSGEWKQLIRDWRKGGVGFVVGSVRSKRSRRDTLPVALADGTRVLVRPRQSDFATLRQVSGAGSTD